MGDEQFSVNTTSRQVAGSTVNVLGLRGQLAAETFLILQTELEDLGRQTNHPRVVLDCQELEYISSAGLGVLSKMTKEFRDRGGDIRLTRLQDKIESVVNLLGFNQVIQVFQDLEEAVLSFA